MTDAELAILLVEDNLAHAKLIQRHLSEGRQRFMVRHITTIDELKPAVAEVNPRAILLDLSLPDSPNPAQTVESAVSAVDGVPIIVLTSMSDLDFAVDAVDSGAQDYLVKGDLTPDLLVRAINYAVRRGRLVSELQRSNQDLLHFAYVVAHELRSPLSRMMSTTEWLKTKYQENLLPEVISWIEENQQATRDIASLVSELLSFAKVSPESDVDELRLTELVDQVRSNLAEEIIDSGAEIVCENDGQFVANAILIFNIINNLVSNAIKYCEDKAPQVAISMTECPNGWQITVKDNGIGIDPTDFEQIFSLFARARTGGPRPGVGIGLAFCKQAVEKLGGKMWVESTIGEGSKFHFTIKRPELEAA